MIRVLHLVSSLSKSSGLMSVIMNYYRFIDKSKIQFDFLYFKEGTDNAYKSEIEHLGGNTYLIDYPKVNHNYKENIKSFFRENEKKFDILHVHELYLTFLFANTAKKYGIKKIIGHAHTTKYSDKIIPSIRNRILCFPNRYLLDYRMACSEDAAKTYFGNKTRNNYSTVYNAIDCSKYFFNKKIRNELRKQYELLDSDIVIGNIGRFCNQKNQKFLLEIFDFCTTINSNYKLVFVGSGEQEKMIKDMIKKRNIDDKVLLLGQRSDVDRIYNMFDIFVLPSLFEGLGIVLVEAQVNGLSCIVSDKVPKEAQISKIYKVCSLTMPISEWGNQIEKISHKRNPHIKDDLLKSKYKIEIQSKELEEIYLKILNEAKE